MSRCMAQNMFQLPTQQLSCQFRGHFLVFHKKFASLIGCSTERVKNLSAREIDKKGSFKMSHSTLKLLVTLVTIEKLGTLFFSWLCGRRKSKKKSTLWNTLITKVINENSYLLKEILTQQIHLALKIIYLTSNFKVSYELKASWLSI